MMRCAIAFALSLKSLTELRISILLPALALKGYLHLLELLFLICASVLAVAGFLAWDTVSASSKPFGQIWDILCLDDWFLEDLFGEFLVVKPRKISRDFDWDNSRAGGVLTQAQNSFETWHNFAGAIPFSSA
jgi:hypothetical protein